MAEIIRFPRREQVELDGGTLTDGPTEHVGSPWYIVELVDEEGGRLVLWDGPSYAAAVETLRYWRQNGYRAVDLLEGAL